MGVLLANLRLSASGVLLPQAYVAFSRNTVIVQPVQAAGEADVRYDLTAAFGVWNSMADRDAGRTPVYSDMVCTRVAALDRVYPDLYLGLKAKFPILARDVLAAGDPNAPAGSDPDAPDPQDLADAQAEPEP